MQPRRPFESKEPRTKPRRTRPLQVEQLEARLMNAIDTIELGLEAFSSSRLREPSPSDAAATYANQSTNMVLSNSAPSIVRSISFATGNVSTGTSVQASVLATDQAGEMSLVYRWSVVRSPSGSAVSFSANNSNAAKNTTLRFDRAGEYEIMATAVDGGGLTASTTSRLTVQPVVASVQVFSADNRLITPASSFSTSQGDPVFRVQGRDQFGQALAQTPSPAWSLRGGPPNATMTQNGQGEFTRFNFSQVGSTYSLQASIGSLTTQFFVQNVRSSARIDLLDSLGRVIPSGGLVEVSGDRASLTIQAYNQQGVALATPSNVSVSIVSAPTGGTVQTSVQGSRATIAFNRVGTYDLAIQANGFSRRVQYRVNPVLSSLAVSPNGASVTIGQSRQYTASRLDQFGMAMSTSSTITWSTTRGTITANGLFTASQSSGAGTITATSGSVRSTVQVNVLAPPAVTTSLQARDSAGNVLSDVNPIVLSGRQLRTELRIVDSSGRIVSSSPTVTTVVNSAPTGGSATIAINGGWATIDFTRAGSYELTFSSGGMSRKLRATVSSTLTSLQLTPNAVTLQAGQTRQFTAVGLDQFGQSMASVPSLTWSAVGGTVSSSGLFTAGSVAGSASVRAQAGSVSAAAIISVTAPSSTLQNAALSQLVQTYYVDRMLDRTEMMTILRSVGSDSVVDAIELTDLRNLVNSTQYVMPAHVRGLAQNTVTDNPANLRFQGQAAGNLTAGASSTLLNRLVDKWFLGVDLPALAGSATGYTRATGSVFQVNPTLADVKQGMIGDCYFLAAVGSIASRNPQAIRDMFDDNGDGTFTVRFFGRNSSGAATADYVTVDRRLPTLSGNLLAYASYGLSATSASTVLWVGLAEKAYAQWNETQRAGRDGTNSYRGIEGGWMSNVNFQVLGYNSTNQSFATSTAQTLINALNSGWAVTAGTKSSVPSGLVASHAYSITGYNSATGRFTVHNPWGFMHPAPLTWGELQAGFSVFTTTDPRGSGGDVVSSGFRSESLAISTAPVFGLEPTQQVTLIPMAGIETLNHIETIGFAMADGLPGADGFESGVELRAEPDHEDEPESGLFDRTDDRVLKDLALMDLYMNVLGDRML